MTIERYLQSDKRWKDYELVQGDKETTIGKIGCLHTTICNFLNQYKYSHTPLTLAKLLQENGGYDKNGFIIWSVIEKLFNMKQRKFIFPDKPLFKNMYNEFYAIQVPYQETGHFCEVLKTNGKDITYFDTYTGETLTTNSYISIRLLHIS